MERKDSVKFFLRFLLLTVITVITVVFGFVLVSAGGVGVILGVVLVIANVFFLLFFLVMATAKLLKHIFDKEKEYFDYMYVVNFLFTVLINGVFMMFYFMLIAGAMVLLLPFLA